MTAGSAGWLVPPRGLLERGRSLIGILMVISETQTGNRMAEVLRGEEMTPSIAGDKQEALRQLDKEPPDAVIVNLDGAGS